MQATTTFVPPPTMASLYLRRNTTPRAHLICVLLSRIRVGDNQVELPSEIIATIVNSLDPNTDVPNADSTRKAKQPCNTRKHVHPAAKPPKESVCVMMKLPTELRQKIFSDELTARSFTYTPACEELQGRRIGKEVKNALKQQKADHERTVALMTINKTICREISTMIYEERVFEIHVHEGVKFGGVEFFNSARQKLQYMDDVMEDLRFHKFTHGGEFSFDRLKKIRVVVFPPCVDEPARAAKYCSLNTFFMNWTLCQLLHRADEEGSNKITRFSVEFAMLDKENAKNPAGRRAITAEDNYLWDAVRGQPSITSIHNLSDIQLLLMPFSLLRSHSVDIELPSYFYSHTATVNFVSDLGNTIRNGPIKKSPVGFDFLGDQPLLQVRGLYYDLARAVLDGICDGSYILSKTIVRDLDEYDFMGDEICASSTLPNKRESTISTIHN